MWVSVQCCFLLKVLPDVDARVLIPAVGLGILPVVCCDCVCEPLLNTSHFSWVMEVETQRLHHMV